MDSLCMELQVHPACVRLWEECLAFFGDAQRKHGLARWTVDLELHCEATSRTSTPSANLHGSPRRVVLSGRAMQFKASNPYVSAEAPRACGHSTFDQGQLLSGKVGGIKMEANYRACVAFPIQQEWVTNLWQRGKISSARRSLKSI